MGPSSVGDLPPSRIVELLGNIYRYISKPTGYAGEDSEPTGIDLSSIVDTHTGAAHRASQHEQSFRSSVTSAVATAAKLIDERVKAKAAHLDATRRLSGVGAREGGATEPDRWWVDNN